MIEATPQCCDGPCQLAIKQAFYSIEFILNLAFIIHSLLTGRTITGVTGAVTIVISSFTSFLFAVRSLRQTQPSGSGCSFIKTSIGTFPIFQLIGIYRCNINNPGLKYFLCYSLALTNYTTHIVDSMIFMFLRLTLLSELTMPSIITLGVPIAINMAGLIMSTVDWEYYKRAKCHESHDLKHFQWCKISVLPQNLAKYVIYTLMISSRVVSCFVFLNGISWSVGNPEVKYLLLGCHATLFGFIFGTFWIKSDGRLALANCCFRTVFVAFNQVFYNQLGCFLKVPFSFHFIPSYMVNLAAIAIICVIRNMFPAEFRDMHVYHTEALLTPYSIAVYGALGMYCVAGLLVLVYRKCCLPGVLKNRKSWKYAKSSWCDI